MSVYFYSSGDYAVLIKSGMHWFTALLFNFISALTAIIGLFIGVAVSQNTATANEWILAVTAGLFLYIGLVDLVSNRDNKIIRHDLCPQITTLRLGVYLSYHNVLPLSLVT